MKRFVIALSIVILLAIFASCSPILAQPAHIPHQNPATATGSPGLASLLLFYSNIFDLATVSQYQHAQDLLDELEHANIPDELRYLTDRFNALSRQLFTTLENLELLLDDASNLLAHYQVSEVKEKLDEAETTIHSAQFLLEDIEAATNALSDKLGVFAAVAGSEIRRNYERLEEMLQRVRQLTNELNQLQQNLTKKHEIQVRGELIATELSLDTTSASAFVGDSITVSGRLTAGGNPLANRKLTVILDNKPLVTTTDLDGSYITDITIPYRYVSTMTLDAVYTASDYDIETYLGSASSPMVINTSFYPTLLKLSAPETAYLELPLTISGEVSSTGGAIDRAVKVLLDDTLLAEETTQGEFNIKIALPPQLSTDKYTLTLDVTPHERYAGASKSLPINILTQVPIQIDVQAPLLTVIPKTIRISGNVYHGLTPVTDARVTLVFKEATSTIRTSTDGSFITTIEAPFDLSLIGPQELTTIIEPVEPWYASLEVKRQIFTINPASIGMMLVAFVSLGLLVFSRVRTRLPSPREEMVISQAELPELPGVTPPEPKYEFTGTKGRILSAYLSGLEAVEEVSGIAMVPYTTLREFANAASPRLPGAIKPFTELTTIAENALYSSHKLDENTAAKAELLAGITKEELHSGAA